MYGASISNEPMPMSAVAAGKQRATHFSDSAFSGSEYVRDARSSFAVSAYGQPEFDYNAPMPSGASAFFSQRAAGEFAANNFPVPLMDGVNTYRPGTGFEVSSPTASPMSNLVRTGHSSEEFDRAWQGHHDDEEHAEIALAVSRRAEVAEIKSLPSRRTPLLEVDPVARVSVGVEQVLGGPGGSPTEEQQRQRLRYLQGGPMGPRPKPTHAANTSRDMKASLDGFGLEY